MLTVGSGFYDGPADQLDRGPGAVFKRGRAEEDASADNGRDDAAVVGCSLLVNKAAAQRMENQGSAVR